MPQRPAPQQRPTSAQMRDWAIEQYNRGFEDGEKAGRHDFGNDLANLNVVNRYEVMDPRRPQPEPGYSTAFEEGHKFGWDTQKDYVVSQVRRHDCAAGQISGKRAGAKMAQAGITWEAGIQLPNYSPIRQQNVFFTREYDNHFYAWRQQAFNDFVAADNRKSQKHRCGYVAGAREAERLKAAGLRIQNQLLPEHSEHWRAQYRNDWIAGRGA